MTNDELKEYYANLLILQYRGKPKAYATAKFLSGIGIADQLPAQIRDAFDIESAEGVQLNVIGQIVGVKRTIANITLSDDDFRILIKFAIITNSNGSSTYDIQQLIHSYFPDQIYFFDYQTMRVSYFIDSQNWSEDLAQVAILQDLLPYPMAVERSSIIYAPVLNTFFGFRTYESEGYNNSPFNTYDDYQIDWPWLTYEYSLTPNEQHTSFLLLDDDTLLDIGDGGGLIL